MQIQQQIEEKTRKIEAILNQYLPKEEGYQKRIMEAMNYSFTAGGKRLRPMLMQETYRMFGGSSRVIEPFMAAMEMIHTYSLIHDDLPAMDNDEYRRGKKTTHVVYGEAMAILAGDGLLNFAYETALSAFSLEPENQRIPQALQVLANKAGIYGMVGGQTVDVETDQTRVVSKDQIDFIYRLKTSALLEASMMIGGILAGANANELEQLERIAGKVGLAFQIQDDILDVTGSAEVLGKPVGSDDKNQKATYVSYEGLEKAKADVNAYSQEALQELKQLSVKNDFLEELVRYLINREK
ncbi:MAG: polyprenyl synthetase family protein [Lachnospiraceae bacterium]|nr:polyprenyl synthetase family protein [Lachnospiraceae bacterium]